MEIQPTEMSQGHYDYQEVQCLGAKLIDGAQKTKFFFSSACIYRVPIELRKLKESAYTPRLIAIGPLHRKDEHLQTPMRHIKLSYANNLLCRLTNGTDDQELVEQKKLTVLRECMVAIKTSLDDAKKCYPEEVTLDVEMLLVDGCFILEFLYTYFWQEEFALKSKGADPIFGNGSTCMIVEHDLLLLENQIPFLVLEKLFSLTVAQIPNIPGKNLLLTNYVLLPYVDHLMHPAKGNFTNSGSTGTFCWPRDCIVWISGDKMNSSKPEEKVPSEEVVSSEQEGFPSRNANYYHILHKLHDNFVPRDQTGKGPLRQFMPSASELVYAGVKFVPGTENDLFKVKFTEPEGLFWWCHTARFEIPSVRIQDFTEPFLRNFIAFEQCCPDISKHFTSYVVLMDMLVNSDIDVQVLEKAGVVRNWLGASEDVTNLFNKLCKEVSIAEFLFAETCTRATRYSKRFRPKNMAYLRRQYFASPWKFIAFCLGFVYFGLTIAQLIISIIIK